MERPARGWVKAVTDAATATSMQGRTTWSKKVGTPLRRFLRTEAGSAGVLLAAIVLALVWANVADGSYERFWEMRFALDFQGARIDLSLREWVNSGLMTLFFLVVGLEARREFDLGDLRDRRRFILPAAAGVVGMIIPVSIFLIANHHGAGGHAWGVAMS